MSYQNKTYRDVARANFLFPVRAVDTQKLAPAGFRIASHANI